MIKSEKIFPSIYKETQGIQRLYYPPLHQDALPTQITNKTKSDHNFLYPRERRQKNVPVTIVDPSVNTFSMEITVIFYNFFNILRPSRKPFRDVTLYCKGAVSIELIDIISLV